MADAATPTPNTIHQAYWYKATGHASYSGSHPTAATLNFSGTYTVTKTGTPSCNPLPELWVDNVVDFSTPVPLIATLSYHKTGASYTELYIQNNNSSAYEEMYGEQFSSSATDTIYLPAGSYSAELESELQPEFQAASVPSSGQTQTGSGALGITFAVAGAATSGPKGAASTYVKLASARTCSKGILGTAITTNTTLAKQISQVIYTVNGHVVRHLYASQVKPGLTVNLALAARSSARVVVTVILKNGSHVTESATYLPCTL